jgi:hypothetical protein
MFRSYKETTVWVFNYKVNEVDKVKHSPSSIFVFYHIYEKISDDTSLETNQCDNLQESRTLNHS